MDTKEKLYQIENGPSRDRLVDAFKYAYDKDARVDIHFDVALGYTAPRDDPKSVYIPAYMGHTRIVALEHESGSGHSYNLRGYCLANLVRMDGFATDESEGTQAYQFVAYYNTANRTGTIRFNER